MSGTSPASSGPGGGHFEGQVGAHYLLSMLAHAEPRGLPGTSILRVEFEKADEGFPLDDVVVRAQDELGQVATLQIQVKRRITFSTGDPVFQKVVGQIAEAIGKPGFWGARNELAIATARTSRKIDGAYQDVLKWARELGSASTFFARLARPGSANDDMRRFVSTFRSHLGDAGALHDDESVWKILARLQILVFDFTAAGSASEELVRERAVRVLSPEAAPDASKLWSAIVETALGIALNGGDRDRERMVQGLTEKGFRLGAGRRLAAVRKGINEASQLALADIPTRVGTANLSRSERVAAVHDALDRGRYVEIRGDAGVGKSGILKHVAELICAEARVIVLSPGRIAEKGWTAMRTQLAFDGTARELLSDLAADGGAILFIDNLDSFNDAERMTVKDLVREAAAVPGVSIVATARRNFGVQEESWLPPELLDQIGRAPAVMIDQLSAAEIAELTNAEPRLAWLMRNDHPARNVVRNLYRLSRIARRRASEPMPTTELDMADEWWITADGNFDPGLRERARVLRAIGEQALSGTNLVNVSDQPAAAVDALVATETLFDRGNDIVAFRHDVLREWAIGNLLNSDSLFFSKLQLDRPASAIMARGVELAARFALERDGNGDRWVDLLSNLTGPSIHESWRRAVLLALIHSEATAALLDRETDRLLANGASLLNELIRTMTAVDVEPASDLYAAAGLSPDLIPPCMFVPSGPSWTQLVRWLLKLGTKLPAPAMRDVVELYSKWMIGTLGIDRLTPLLLAWLHAWLVELEGGDDFKLPEAVPKTYTGAFGHREAEGLIDNLRTAFLAFCQRKPELAVSYLKHVMARKQSEGIVSSIFKFRGTLAQAAPKELAEMTAKALIAARPQTERYGRQDRDERPFAFIDYELHPPSPSQGPFLELLTHAPTQGLDLVRRLVTHAVDFSVRGRDPRSDGFRLRMPDGERFFPWSRTFTWSRNQTSHNGLNSALMALELWAHMRLDAGEEFAVVLDDVLGPPGTPAAFLLVAIDIILSHWPQSREAAIPFVGCPELLCADRERHTLDQFEYPDLFGLKALEREPKAGPSKAMLKERPSRRATLEKILGQYALYDPPEHGQRLKALLEAALQRLGDFEVDSTFADPRFMARYALNMLDPTNWREQDVQLDDGRMIKARAYVSPDYEAKHVEALESAHAPKAIDARMRLAVGLALDKPGQSSHQLAEQAALWARNLARVAEEADEEKSPWDAVLSAALITVRDGTDELRAKHGAWAEDVFLKALTSADDVGQRMRSGLNFNPFATAFVGLFELYRRSPKPETLKRLLEIAARDNPAGAHGFVVSVASLATLDERVPKSIVRCGLIASKKPSRSWEVSADEKARRDAAYQDRLSRAIDAELAWLNNDGDEPAWPEFTAEVPRRRRRGIRIGGSPAVDARVPETKELPGTYIDDQAAALWLRSLRPILDVVARPWLVDLARTYSDFTSATNGARLGPDEELANLRDKWNDAYYELVARTLEALDQNEVEALAITPITVLPDKSFYDVAPHLLRPVDVIFFNNHKLAAKAPIIREAFAKRLSESRGWKRLAGDESSSIETHLGPCIGSLFFNDYLLRETRSYLSPSATERIEPFLPSLLGLVRSGPHFFVALVTLDLVEVKPRAALLPLTLEAAMSWFKSYPDNTTFWVSNGVGRRLCDWFKAVLAVEPDAFTADKRERSDVDRILTALVRLGLPEARQLESTLSAI